MKQINEYEKQKIYDLICKVERSLSLMNKHLENMEVSKRTWRDYSIYCRELYDYYQQKAKLEDFK